MIFGKSKSLLPCREEAFRKKVYTHFQSDSAEGHKPGDRARRVHSPYGTIRQRQVYSPEHRRLPGPAHRRPVPAARSWCAGRREQCHRNCHWRDHIFSYWIVSRVPFGNCAHIHPAWALVSVCSRPQLQGFIRPTRLPGKNVRPSVRQCLR